MAPRTLMRWAERTLALLLLLSILIGSGERGFGYFSSLLFKVSTALFFFYYLAWPWLFVPPLEERRWWSRLLHFTAPFLWAYNFLAILLARITEAFMSRGTVADLYEYSEGGLSLLVIILSIKGIHASGTVEAVRYHGWILARVFLTGGLSYWVLAQ